MNHDSYTTSRDTINLTLPHTQPWGPSSSINSASQRNEGQYEIEMQSGDIIRIDARDVKLTSIAEEG